MTKEDICEVLLWLQENKNMALHYSDEYQIADSCYKFEIEYAIEEYLKNKEQE